MILPTATPSCRGTSTCRSSTPAGRPPPEPVGADRSRRHAAEVTRRGRARKSRSARSSRCCARPTATRGRAAELLGSPTRCSSRSSRKHRETRSVTVRRRLAWRVPLGPSVPIASRDRSSSSVTRRRRVAIVVDPIAGGSTKCSVPATTFLSRAIASITSTADRSAIGGSGPILAISAASASRSVAASVPRARPARPRRQHPVATASPWRKRRYLVTAFERVAGGVAEVQRAARAGFALVALDHVRLDAARLGDHRQSAVGSRANSARQRRSHDAIEQRRLAITPYLTTS